MPKHRGVCIAVASLVALVAAPMSAAPMLHLEVGNRGMASVTLTLEPGTKPSNAAQVSAVNVVALPFELDVSHNVSKSDETKVAVLHNGDGYALLAIMTPISIEPATIKLDNAFNLVDERAQGRVKFECDTSFKYLQKHRGVLALPTTISKFDIEITLPRDYRNDQLSFEPPKDRWVEKRPGREYSLALVNSSVSKKPVFIAFPSPFESGLKYAKFVVGLLIAVVLVVAEGGVAVTRAIGAKTIIGTFFSSIIAIFAVAYFYHYVADPLEFISWAIGPLIPLVVAPFVCIGLLVRMYGEAEVGGRVTIGNEPARYISVVMEESRTGNPVEIKTMTVKLDGNYQFFMWCGKSTKSVRVVASGTGASRTMSDFHDIQRGDKRRIPTIDVQELPVESTQGGPVTPVTS